MNQPLAGSARRLGFVGQPSAQMVAWRLALFSLLWMVLTGGELKAFWLASLVILVATWSSIRLLPLSFGIRPQAGARFALFFLAYSFRGGVDVALRAIHVPPKVRPGMIEFSLRLPAGTARTFFMMIIGLFPGTLSTGTEGDTLHVHVLHDQLDADRQLRALELHVARAFGVKIDGA